MKSQKFWNPGTGSPAAQKYCILQYLRRAKRLLGRAGAMRLRSEGGKSEVLESWDGFSGGAKVLHFAVLAQSTVLLVSPVMCKNVCGLPDGYLHAIVAAHQVGKL